MRRYFFYDPQEDVVTFFSTLAARDACAQKVLQGYRDAARHGDGWPEEVFQLCCGIVTHAVEAVNVVTRVGELDEDGYDEAGELWEDEDQTETCEVVLVELPPHAPHAG